MKRIQLLILLSVFIFHKNSFGNESSFLSKAIMYSSDQPNSHSAFINIYSKLYKNEELSWLVDIIMNEMTPQKGVSIDCHNLLSAKKLALAYWQKISFVDQQKIKYQLDDKKKDLNCNYKSFLKLISNIENCNEPLSALEQTEGLEDLLDNSEKDAFLKKINEVKDKNNCLNVKPIRPHDNSDKAI